jgi:hypothetical protein
MRKIRREPMRSRRPEAVGLKEKAIEWKDDPEEIPTKMAFVWFIYGCRCYGMIGRAQEETALTWGVRCDPLVAVMP